MFLDTQKLATAFLEGAATKAGEAAMERFLEETGLIPKRLTLSNARPLLDEYIQRLEARLDEDRLAKLHGAFLQLKDAPKTLTKQDRLSQALAIFPEIASIPAHGMTGNFRNAQLRCLAFLGMAAAYAALGDSQELIAEKIAQAVSIDPFTAEPFLGRDFMRQLLAPLQDRILIGHTDAVLSVTFSHDGLIMASASADKTVRLWNALTGDLQRSFTGHRGTVRAVAFFPNDKTVASAGVYSVMTTSTWTSTSGMGFWAREGQHSSTRTEYQGEVRNYNVQTEKLESNIGALLAESSLGNEESVSSLAFSPNCQMLVIGSSRDDEYSDLHWTRVKLWSYLEKSRIRKLAVSRPGTYSVAFSPSGKVVVSGDADGVVRLSIVKTGKLTLALTGHREKVTAVAFSPKNGKLVVSGSADKTVRIWELTDAWTGRIKHVLLGHTNEVTSVAFSPDSRTVVTGSTDKTIKLWDVFTGQLLKTFTGHSEGICAVAFSPDGRTIASGSADKTVRLWDMYW